MLQNCEKVNFRCWSPLSLWCLGVAAQAHEYIGWLTLLSNRFFFSAEFHCFPRIKLRLFYCTPFTGFSLLLLCSWPEVIDRLEYIGRCFYCLYWCYALLPAGWLQWCKLPCQGAHFHPLSLRLSQTFLNTWHGSCWWAKERTSPSCCEVCKFKWARYFIFWCIMSL